MLRLSYFPSKWKQAKTIMMKKLNKPENLIIISDYQFGFHHKHGTPEQCHRIIKVISDSFDRKMFCSGVFLNVKQAFDRVWHEGLLYKLKHNLPAPYYSVLKSYLQHRKFHVKIDDEL